MHYEHIATGTFLSRPNRFIAHVMIGGKETVCHVKNTGRCRELLVPGAKLILEYHPNAQGSGRKTSYDVIAVYKGRMLINMDSQAPNAAACEWVSSGGLLASLPAHAQISDIRREAVWGNSRFDLAFMLDGKQAFMEVKGVTLEREGTAAFPDAPTIRGVKHLDELASYAKEGHPAFLLLVIQMKGVTRFIPNTETHPEFGAALLRAKQAGVTLLAYDCLVTENAMAIHEPVPICLTEGQMKKG